MSDSNQTRDNESKPTPPVDVEITLVLDRFTAMWLIEIAELHGDSPRNVAARILEDVAREDRLAHDESDQMTLH